jgi:hypothetical protein
MDAHEGQNKEQVYNCRCVCACVGACVRVHVSDGICDANHLWSPRNSWDTCAVLGCIVAHAAEGSACQWSLWGAIRLLLVGRENREYRSTRGYIIKTRGNTFCSSNNSVLPYKCKWSQSCDVELKWRTVGWYVSFGSSHVIWGQGASLQRDYKARGLERCENSVQLPTRVYCEPWSCTCLRYSFNSGQ